MPPGSSGSVFVCLSGVLLAPSVNLDSMVLTLLVVQSFGAAAIGRFSNIPLTYVGGLAIGVVASLITRYVSGTSDYLAGLSQSVPFIVLFVVLIVTPRSKLVDRRINLARPTQVWRAPARVQAVGAALLLVVLISGPLWFGARLSSFTIALSYVVLFLSLGLLVKNSNQVSLAHVGFAATGCVAFSVARVEWGLPWVVALVLAALITIPIGALIALPAIRLSGIYLALATFAFGLILEVMFYNSELMFGPSTAGLPMPRPQVLGLDTDLGYYYLVLTVVAVCTLFLVASPAHATGPAAQGARRVPGRAGDEWRLGTAHEADRLLSLVRHGGSGRRAVRQHLHQRRRPLVPLVQLADPARAAPAHAGRRAVVRRDGRLLPGGAAHLPARRRDRARRPDADVRAVHHRVEPPAGAAPEPPVETHRVPRSRRWS